MKLQAIASSVALVVALSFSGSALAQNQFGDFVIQPGDLQMFQDKCDALSASAAPAAPAGAEDVDETATGTVPQATPGTDTTPSDEGAAQERLANLTIEECVEAGLTAQ